MATGNNITLTGDTARRVLISRLESELAGHGIERRKVVEAKGAQTPDHVN